MFYPAPYADYEFIKTDNLIVSKTFANPKNTTFTTVKDFNLVNFNRGLIVLGKIAGNFPKMSLSNLLSLDANTIDFSSVFNFIEFDGAAPMLKLSSPSISAGIELEGEAGINFGINTGSVENDELLFRDQERFIAPRRGDDPGSWFSINAKDKEYNWFWRIDTDPVRLAKIFNNNNTSSWVMDVSCDMTAQEKKSATTSDTSLERGANIFGQNLLVAKNIGAGVTNLADINNNSVFSTGDKAKYDVGIIYKAGNGIAIKDAAKLKVGWHNYSGTGTYPDSGACFSVNLPKTDNLWREAFTIKANRSVGINVQNPSNLNVPLTIGTGGVTDVKSSSLVFLSAMNSVDLTKSFAFKSDNDNMNVQAMTNHSGMPKLENILSVNKTTGNVNIGNALSPKGVKLEIPKGSSFKIGQTAFRDDGNRQAFLSFANLAKIGFFNNGSIAFSPNASASANSFVVNSSGNVSLEGTLSVSDINITDDNKPIHVMQIGGITGNTITVIKSDHCPNGYDSNIWVCFTAGFFVTGLDIEEWGNYPVLYECIALVGPWAGPNWVLYADIANAGQPGVQETWTVMVVAVKKEWIDITYR